MLILQHIPVTTLTPINTYSFEYFYLLHTRGSKFNCPSLMHTWICTQVFIIKKGFSYFFFFSVLGLNPGPCPCSCFTETHCAKFCPLVMIFKYLFAHLPNSTIVKKDNYGISRWGCMCIFHESWQYDLKKGSDTVHPCDKAGVSLRRANCRKF